MSTGITLEQLADLVAERLYPRLASRLEEQIAERFERFIPALARAAPEARALVTAKDVARMTGMSPRWVYDHADDIGVVRAGNGSRPRLRFDPDLVRAKLAQRDRDDPEPPPSAPRLRPLPARVELLPVRGRAA